MSNQSAIIKPFMPGETVGPYTIVRLLPSGEGGQARVYEALQAGTQRRVALKVALSGKASFLRDEGSFMRAFKLHHPNIVQIVATPIGGGMEEHVLKDPRSNAWYFAMEYLPGGSLADWLGRRKKLPVGTAVEIARQIALALDVAHSAGLVHLDIKPSNVLFRQPPEKAHKIEAVLTDFGISRPQVHMTSSADTVTSLTVEYASPEQARLAQEHIAANTTTANSSADIQVGPRSDLYSLATILYEMLTGHLPFQLQSHDDLVYLHKVVYDPPELPVPGVPPELNAILARALHKDPDTRYPSARAFADDLGRLALQPATKPSSGQRFNNWLMGLAGLVIGLIVGFVIGQSAAAAPSSSTSAIVPTLPPTLAAPGPVSPTTVKFVATEAPPEPSATPVRKATIEPTSTLRPTVKATATPR